jgi:hypothetical protein
LYSHLRFVTAAVLIAFGSTIGIGALALLSSAVKGPLVAMMANSNSPATPCKQPTWLHFDRDCLSQRNTPWIAGREASDAVTVEVAPAANDEREQLLTESQHTATVLQKSVPMEPAPQEPAQRSDITAPVNEAPAQRPAAEERPTAKPAIEAQSRLPALKKAARRDRTAKRPANEALNAVRKFGDTLHDIPVSAYAADGTRRRIVIRPTSIQDVYYYSAPR